MPESMTRAPRIAAACAAAVALMSPSLTAHSATGAGSADAVSVTSAHASGDHPVVVAGMDSPESAVWDPVTDTYLVSNIGGALPAAAFAKDGNGFISKLAPDGRLIDRTWIGLGKGGITLNAPKGLALSGRGLFVADIDVVHEFDRETGALIRSVRVPGAEFLNDVTRDPRGGVYVSDSALTLGADDSFVPTESDAIIRISARGRLTTVAKSPALGSPNGLTVDRCGRLLVAGFDDRSEIYTVGRNSVPRTVRALPVGQLDGLEILPDGSFAVSSFETGAVLRVPTTGEAVTEYDAETVADLGVDRHRDRLLLPLIFDGALVIEPIG
jgi:sugar lactone lactonase YvrE